MKNVYVVLVCFCLIGCNARKNGKEDTVNRASSAMIEEFGIDEEASRLDLANENIPGLAKNTDTLELTYYFAFCDCQRWILSSEHSKALSQVPDLDELDSRGQVQFNLQTHGYYIEPAAKKLELNWRIEVNGTKVKFIGRQYTDLRLPEDGGFTVPDPPMGKVFRYYSYQVIRPYKIWGAQKFTGDYQENGDSLFETEILTVE